MDSRTRMLTQKEWYPTMVRTKTSMYHIADGSVALDPCSLDNVLSFQTNGSYAITDGASSCTNISQVGPEWGTWLFEDRDNTQYLTLIVNTGSGNVEKSCYLDHLDDNTLTYTYYSSPQIIYYQCTFSH